MDSSLSGARSFFWDNLKGFLIVMVVLGHMMEQILPNGAASGLYKVIYLFHMPLFVFCSGYLSRFSPRKILRQLLLPYVIIQILYGLIIYREIQLTTPYGLLWYLPALAVWRITIPFLERCSGKRQWIVICAAVVAACLIGFDNTVGYYASLSRLIVFYPFFVTGHYAKTWRQPQVGWGGKIAAAAVLAVVLVVFFFLSMHVDSRWLYGSYGYQSGKYHILYRLGHYLAAAVVAAAVLALTSVRKTFFAPWGRNSYMIYLIHPLIAFGIGWLIGKAGIDLWILYLLSMAAAVACCIVIARVSTWVRTIKIGRVP